MTSGESAKPIIEVFDDLMAVEVFSAACQACSGARWRFGHESIHDDPIPFWELDLKDDPVFDAVWNQVRARCEALAGRALCVIRQYATGHTYGLGGKPHADDTRTGCFTLLYYAMPEWKQEWEGETVFFDAEGEVIQAIAPRPNRAVLFDSRIVHAGRAPGRQCPALRIAVAYKLEPVPLSEMPSPDAMKPDAMKKDAGANALPVQEVSRDGAERVFSVRIAGARIDALVRERLLETGKGLRLPGFRPGKVPMEVLDQRYAVRARQAVKANFAVEAAQQLLAGGSLTSATQGSDVESGDLLLQLRATHLPDLPDPEFESVALTRLTADDPKAAAALAADFRRQVLDQLDAHYQFTIAPVLVNKEYTSIRTASAAQFNLLSEHDRAGAEAELLHIAERRVRLGAVLLELARRFGITASDTESEGARGTLLEDRVIARLVTRAKVTERQASSEEIAALTEF